jgi:sulfate transporter 3
VSGVDTNGVSFFKELKKTTAKKDIELVFVNPLSEVVEKLQRADEQKEFMRPEFLFLTVAEAVASLSLKGPSLSNV